VEASRSLEQRLLGKTLAGKYQLVEVQASGAFGIVFRANQYFYRHLMRQVAVKVSRQSGLTEESAPKLFSDALVLARLLANSDLEGRHHLVQIYDMGLLPEYEDRAYLVMEYVDGLPLLTHMQAAGRFSVATGLRFVKQICRALALVHKQGAVHRDLKSDNILVDRKGVVRVVDFGLADYTDSRSGFVAGAMGTYTYMAPETVLGRSTPASDIYSLGLLLYELFTGGGPHRTAPWMMDEDHRQDNYRIKKEMVFPPPSGVQNEIRNDHRWLDELIRRCLHVEPEQRFADAGELLAAIETCEAGGEMPVAAEAARRKPSGWSDGPEGWRPAASSPASHDAEMEKLFRDVRRLLASKAFDQAIDRLDIHRPPEWAVANLTGARTLRLLAQAYLGRGDLPSARECLEQLRTIQKEQQLLPRPDYAAALSDLARCYRGLGMQELAGACQEEARKLM
jgi:serine/threonine-protein kinase